MLYNILDNVYNTLEIHYVTRQVGNKNPKNSTNNLFYYLYLILYSSQNTRKDGYKIQLVIEKGRYPIKPFYATIKYTHKVDRILTRTFHAIAKQSFQQLQILIRKTSDIQN